jgi:PPOX class probable F420-dependent enzyme
MGVELPGLARELLDQQAFAVVTTINRDGSPQSSVIWARCDGDEIVFSTIRGRRKTRNMERDPRVSFVAYDPADPYRYVEVRGAVTMTEQGGDALIDELCRAYVGQPWPHRPGEIRVVCRLPATHVVTTERGHPQR